MVVEMVCYFMMRHLTYICIHFIGKKDTTLVWYVWENVMSPHCSNLPTFSYAPPPYVNILYECSLIIISLNFQGDIIRMNLYVP